MHGPDRVGRDTEDAVAEAPDGRRANAGPGSPWALYLAFQRLALQGFGGVLPVAHRELVDRLGWLSPQEFVELLALCQVLPGPNIVNLALVFGDRHFGLRGAFAAASGLLALPLLLVLMVATAYRSLPDNPWLSGALRGMGAVAAGLVISTAVKLWGTLKNSPIGRPAGVMLAVGTWVTVGWLRWPMVWVVLVLGSASTAWAWWCLRRTGAAR